ncbi:MAG TPA: xanthine dehydrogenase family protein molybdopterin-binding subunit [Candidatus Aquilonibacter sp.]|nr:xanthine dehydrogenase family protein molybdopterin-binding subunit [Candidatus Aquilonibacter sp.]
MSEQQQQQPAPLPQPPHRYDGIAKVTGTAKYAAEFKEPFPKQDLVYAYVVQSTIPCGTVKAIDAKAAERAPGVVAVLTPFNTPKLQVGPPKPPGKRNLSLLQDKEVHYNGQPIAVVVARSLPEAWQAARMLKITYDEQPAKLDFMGRLNEARPPKNPGKDPAKKVRGDVEAAQRKATVTVENTYITPLQNHNPMEPHATVAWWEGEKLSVYDSTQYISGDRMSLAGIFSLPLENVHVMDPYVGGGFGCKGSTWSHVPLCAMAAKIVQKPVQLALERPQMFGPVGARPATVNKIKLSATADGKLTAIQQDSTMTTSLMEDFVEPVVVPARILYASEANETSSAMVDMNIGIGTFMRAPGESSGTAVLEIAMDELAEKLKIDPVQLRIINYAEVNPDEHKPWSSKHLRECYTQGAERFGWAKLRESNAMPGQKIEGNNLIGYGMATATYPANRSAAMAVVRFMPDGRVFVGSGTQDLGTGMYTIMAQTAAEELGLDISKMDVKLGDSTLPKAPVSGGSQSAASVCPAVEEACKQAKLKAGTLAAGDERSPLHGAALAEIEVHGGRVFVKNDSSRGEEITALIARNGNQPIEAEGSAEPGEDKTATSAQSFGAVFAEVAVDKDTHMVKVRRVVGVYDIGTLMNHQTGINQLQGGIVWGVGFALTEETHLDPVTGRTVNENLGEYHVPVNADIGELDVTVLNIPDLKFNPMGARGIGEIGITGAAAAVANAVYNATGKRVRDYPITPDKIMRA